jgi:hypothetical protein
VELIHLCVTAVLVNCYSGFISGRTSITQGQRRRRSSANSGLPQIKEAEAAENGEWIGRTCGNLSLDEARVYFYLGKEESRQKLS